MRGELGAVRRGFGGTGREGWGGLAALEESGRDLRLPSNCEGIWGEFGWIWGWL